MARKKLERIAYRADSLKAVPLGAKVGVGGLPVGNFVAVRTGQIEDDLGGLGIFFLGDCGKGAEELVGDVGEHGCATGRDLLFGQEEEKTRKEVIDGDGGAKFLEIGGKRDGGVCAFPHILRELGVHCAKQRVRIGSEKAAAHGIGEAMAAAIEIVAGAGFLSLLSHGCCPLKKGWGTPPGFCIDVKTRDLCEEGFVSA
jgi:hypothetical protein